MKEEGSWVCTRWDWEDMVSESDKVSRNRLEGYCEKKNEITTSRKPSFMKIQMLVTFNQLLTIDWCR